MFSRMLILSIALLALTGCRGIRKQDVWQSVLEAEKRALEDRIYQLEGEVAALHEKLDSTRRENTALRQELQPEENLPLQRRQPGADSREAFSPDTLEGPVIELDDTSATEELRLGGPENLNASVETPSPVEDHRVSAQEASAPLAGLGNLGGLTGEQAPLAKADDPVASIWLNPMLTGGDDRDNRPGDEGISVVIEPRNAEGAYVPQAGSVAVVVLDPGKSGPAARVARWDFDIAEARSRLKTSALGRGIHLALPWPNKPPENDRLHLFVRYTTADQRRLEADREIRIDLLGNTSARWTPSAGGRRSTAAGGQAMVLEARPQQAEVASPYAHSQPGPQEATAESLERHRIDVAQEPETQAPPAGAEPARTIQRPKWVPFR